VCGEGEGSLTQNCQNEPPPPARKSFPGKIHFYVVQELLHFKLFIRNENRVKRRTNENTDPVTCNSFCTDELHLTFT
jgi:hypothetical protein